MRNDEILARRAAERWDLAGGVIEHVGTSAGSVWRCNAGAERLYLRLGSPAARALELVQGELALVEHLVTNGVSVARPRPSRAGQLVEPVEHEGAHVASMRAGWRSRRSWG